MPLRVDIPEHDILYHTAVYNTQCLAKVFTQPFGIQIDFFGGGFDCMAIPRQQVQIDAIQNVRIFFFFFFNLICYDKRGENPTHTGKRIIFGKPWNSIPVQNSRDTTQTQMNLPAQIIAFKFTFPMQGFTWRDPRRSASDPQMSPKNKLGLSCYFIETEPDKLVAVDDSALLRDEGK